MWPGSGDGSGRPSYCVSWPRWPPGQSVCARGDVEGAKPLAWATPSRIGQARHGVIPEVFAVASLQHDVKAEANQATARWNKRRLPKGQAMPRTREEKKKKQYLLTQRLCAVMLMHAVITRWKDRSVTHRLGHPCPARVRTCNGRYAVNRSMLHTVVRAHVVTLPLYIAPHTHPIRIHTGRPSTSPGGGRSQAGLRCWSGDIRKHDNPQF